MLLLAIPTPPFTDLTLGPLQLHLYGLMIALGVVAAVIISTRRWEARDGSADDITAIAVWAVPAGVIGARIYHVLTDFEKYQDHPADIVRIWDGGLGVWGGVAAGLAVGIWVARRRGLPVLPLMDVAAPGIVVAQAIGRWGNYFNQELFGGPTSLPWALQVDLDHRPFGYLNNATFHPTFLYESIWNLAVAAMLLAVERRWQLRPGRIFALYVAGYCLGRFFIEQLRIDPAHTLLGMRLNGWTSLVLFVVTIGILAMDRWRDRHAHPTA